MLRHAFLYDGHAMEKLTVQMVVMNMIALYPPQPYQPQAPLLFPPPRLLLPQLRLCQVRNMLR